jgi:hypothetical protein
MSPAGPADHGAKRGGTLEAPLLITAAIPLVCENLFFKSILGFHKIASFRSRYAMYRDCSRSAIRMLPSGVTSLLSN